MSSLTKKRDKDMTQGVIWKQMVLFALPLLAGNVFQQLYNTVDSIVVGNYVGKEALAAVGSVSPIIFAMVGFFMGFSTGAGVVISQYYGAKDYDRVSRAVHTTMVMTLILCLGISIAGVTLTPTLLKLMSTPEDVIVHSSSYLRIYFAGVTGLLVYNMGAGILRAVGDSKRPLYFLIFSALMNTALDLIFIVVFRAGIEGVAYATIIAQGLSALLVMIVLMKSDGPYRLELSKLSIDGVILRRVLSQGLPSALQMLITSISNVFVQSYINAFGSSAMAGYSAYTKLDSFLMLPMQSMSLSVTTFVGQNYGAQKYNRIEKGRMTGLALALLMTFSLMVPIIIFRYPLVMLFNRDAEVVSYGVMLVKMMLPFYLVCCVNQTTAGTLRGLGNATAPMIIMLMNFVVARQVYLFIASRVFGTLRMVAFGYPVGWIMCSITLLVYEQWYWKKHFEAKALQMDAE